jgi:MoaA/NifB/PqqE/SkfB family radical SAM enzyme
MRLGDWKKDGLAGAWNGPQLQAFRAKVSDGVFPGNECRTCFRLGYPSSLEGEFSDILEIHAEALRRCDCPFLRDRLEAFQRILPLRQATPASRNAIDELLAALQQTHFQGPEESTAAAKVRTIALAAQAFLERRSVVPVVAPRRMVALTSICNIRCIHCSVAHHPLFEIPGSLEPEFLEEAFARGRTDLVEFLHYGTELLCYQEWREIVVRIASLGCKLPLFTNGMLLTPAVTEFLFRKAALRFVNVSLDGALKSTVEGIRRGVSFETVIEHTRHLIQQCSTQRPEIGVFLSMVLMRRNFQELPALVRLAAELRAAGPRARITVKVDPLAKIRADDDPTSHAPSFASYRAFYDREHHAMIDADHLLAILKEAWALERETGIHVVFTCGGSLEDIVQGRSSLPSKA